MGRSGGCVFGVGASVGVLSKSLTTFSNKNQFWDGMKDDFQHLVQYGITDEYFQCILEKIRDGNND